MKNLLVSTLLLLTITFASSGSALADQTKAPELPEWGFWFLNFTACSADGHEVSVQMKLGNFSPFDIELPEGVSAWATKEEAAQAVAEVFPANIRKHIAKNTDAEVSAPDYVTNLVLYTEETYHGANDKGVEGDWPVYLDLKNILETKGKLVARGKYTALSENFEAMNTFAKVDPAKGCSSSTSN